MLPSLVVKTFRDYRRAWVGWLIGVGAFVAIYAGSWAQFDANPDTAATAIDGIPQGIRDAFGVQDFSTGANYLQGTIYSIFVPLLLIMAAAVFGARAIAGPEDAGVLDLFLANPISRRAFVLQRFAALASVLVVLGLVPWLLVSLFNATLDMGVPVANVAAASLGLLLIGVCFGTLALAVSAVVGRRSTVLATTGAIAAITYVLRVVGDLVDGLGFLRWLSPFHYYLGGDPLREGFNIGYLIVLVLIPPILLILAVVQFERRDLAT